MPVLNDLTVIELGGIGPVPMCGMLLADMGARVIRVEKMGGDPLAIPGDPTTRHRESIAVDLRKPGSKAIISRLLRDADVLLEGFRPGVLEKLGYDKNDLDALNPRLIVGRMTGWGQVGPRAKTAGHDLNYVALSGLLHAMGSSESPPPPPLNMVADYGGGALFLTIGVLGALLERNSSNRGQVIDAAMCDGVATLGGVFYAMQQQKIWSEKRQNNLLDGGAPFYRTYETSDQRFLAVGCLEPKFYTEFIDIIGLSQVDLPAQYNRQQWDTLTKHIATAIRTKSLEEWTLLFDGKDACASPVLTLSEAPFAPHYQARKAFTIVDGHPQPNGAPQFSRTPNRMPATPPKLGEHTLLLLREHGFSEDEIESFMNDGVVRKQR